MSIENSSPLAVAAAYPFPSPGGGAGPDQVTIIQIPPARSTDFYPLIAGEASRLPRRKAFQGGSSVGNLSIP